MDDNIFVNMERITENIVVETTGWLYVPEEKVSVLMTKTPSWWNWRSYRLAYGAQARMMGALRQLRWAPEILKNGNGYDPTMKELFRDVILRDGESYYLLISRLHVAMKSLTNRHKPGQHNYYASREEDQMYRLRDLYPLKPPQNEHAMKDAPERVPPDDRPDDRAFRKRIAKDSAQQSGEGGAGGMAALLQRMTALD
jgi:hypothetical protein